MDETSKGFANAASGSELERLCSKLESYSFADGDSTNQGKLTEEMRSDFVSLRGVLSNNNKTSEALFSIYVGQFRKDETKDTQDWETIVKYTDTSINLLDRLDDTWNKITEINKESNSAETLNGPIMDAVKELTAEIREQAAPVYENEDWGKVEDKCLTSISDNLDKVSDEIKTKVADTGDPNAIFVYAKDTDGNVDSNRIVPNVELSIKDTGALADRFGITLDGRVASMPSESNNIVQIRHELTDYIHALNSVYGPTSDKFINEDGIGHIGDSILKYMNGTLDMDDLPREATDALQKYAGITKELYGINLLGQDTIKAGIDNGIEKALNEMNERISGENDKTDKTDTGAFRPGMDIKQDKASNENTSQQQDSASGQGRTVSRQGSEDMHGRSFIWELTPNADVNSFIMARNSYIENSPVVPTYRMNPGYVYSEMGAVFSAAIHKVPINGKVPGVFECYHVLNQFLHMNVLDFVVLSIIDGVVTAIFGDTNETDKVDKDGNNSDGRAVITDKGFMEATYSSRLDEIKDRFVQQVVNINMGKENGDKSLDRGLTIAIWNVKDIGKELGKDEKKIASDINSKLDTAVNECKSMGDKFTGAIYKTIDLFSRRYWKEEFGFEKNSVHVKGTDAAQKDDDVSKEEKGTDQEETKTTQEDTTRDTVEKALSDMPDLIEKQAVAIDAALNSDPESDDGYNSDALEKLDPALQECIDTIKENIDEKVEGKIYDAVISGIKAAVTMDNVSLSSCVGLIGLIIPGSDINEKDLSTRISNPDVEAKGKSDKVESGKESDVDAKRSESAYNDVRAAISDIPEVVIKQISDIDSALKKDPATLDQKDKNALEKVDPKLQACFAAVDNTKNPEMVKEATESFYGGIKRAVETGGVNMESCVTYMHLINPDSKIDEGKMEKLIGIIDADTNEMPDISSDGYKGNPDYHVELKEKDSDAEADAIVAAAAGTPAATNERENENERPSDIFKAQGQPTDTQTPDGADNPEGQPGGGAQVESSQLPETPSAAGDAVGEENYGEEGGSEQKTEATPLETPDTPENTVETVNETPNAEDLKVPEETFKELENAIFDHVSDCNSEFSDMMDTKIDYGDATFTIQDALDCDILSLDDFANAMANVKNDNLDLFKIEPNMNESYDGIATNIAGNEDAFMETLSTAEADAGIPEAYNVGNDFMADAGSTDVGQAVLDALSNIEAYTVADAIALVENEFDKFEVIKNDTDTGTERAAEDPAIKEYEQFEQGAQGPYGVDGQEGQKIPGTDAQPEEQPGYDDLSGESVTLD